MGLADHGGQNTMESAQAKYCVTGHMGSGHWGIDPAHADWPLG
jgi:hypothetical protein